MFVFLSHIMDETMRVWPGEPAHSVDVCTTIGKNGQQANTVIVHLPDHVGTHFDAPFHFNPKGPSITELPVDYFAYKGEDILLLDIPKQPNEAVTVEDIKPHEETIKKKKLLLLRTGFETVRKEQPEVYQMEGPYLHPDLCRYMVITFPSLLCVGFDFLSVGAPGNGLSAEAHQWLLGKHTDKFITAIEDMILSPLKQSRIDRITLGPLRVHGADSGQVSIIAELADNIS